MRSRSHRGFSCHISCTKLFVLISFFRVPGRFISPASVDLSRGRIAQSKTYVSFAVSRVNGASSVKRVMERPSELMRVSRIANRLYWYYRNKRKKNISAGSDLVLQPSTSSLLLYRVDQNAISFEQISPHFHTLRSPYTVVQRGIRKMDYA